MDIVNKILQGFKYLKPYMLCSGLDFARHVFRTMKTKGASVHVALLTGSKEKVNTSFGYSISLLNIQEQL